MPFKVFIADNFNCPARICVINVLLGNIYIIDYLWIARIAVLFFPVLCKKPGKSEYSISNKEQGKGNLEFFWYAGENLFKEERSSQSDIN